MNEGVVISDGSATIRSILKSQYHAALAMLRDVVERCPPAVWSSTDHTNAFWQVAYHTLFYTHLYLQSNEAAFRPWPGERTDVQYPHGIAGPPDPNSTLPLIGRPYTRSEVMEYWQFCDALVDDAIDQMNLDDPKSGFWWYDVSKLEHQLINIRHVQHHTAQLADRLRFALDLGTKWIAARPSSPTHVR